MKMRTPDGWTVEPAIIDGRPEFIVLRDGLTATGQDRLFDLKSVAERLGSSYALLEEEKRS